MKFFALFCLVSYATAKGIPEGEDELASLNLDDFEDHFHLEHVTDPEEKRRREEALKENEKKVLETNEAYEKGEGSWWDEINEMADLPEDEFEAEHTGLADDRMYARGLIDIPLEYDEASERYFESFRLSRAQVPASYSSVDEGHVTPVKSQGQCGSCTAFATMTAVETCFAKKLGAASLTGDYSEQHFVDCGYNRSNIVYGCDGAALNGYVKWFNQKSPSLASEKGYPYTAKRDTCQEYDPYFQGVSLTNTGYWTNGADEDTMRKLVYEHGAVITGIDASQPWSQYKGGVFAGCGSDYRVNHAVTVVGYGTEDGVDYWLVKNSWGSRWGDKGFIKMKRGVNMCGIGNTMVVVDCEKVDGTTNPPPTTSTTPAPNPTGCIQEREAVVCANGTTAGEYKKDLSEQECAEYCWSLPECNAWSFYNFGNGYCYPYAASDCIERNEGWFWDHASWGSASCGAPKGCEINENTFLCAGNNKKVKRMTSASAVTECAKLCAETKSCAGWTLGHGMKWCYVKTKATCKGSHTDWISGNNKCGQI